MGEGSGVGRLASSSGSSLGKENFFKTIIRFQAVVVQPRKVLVLYYSVKANQ